MNILITGGTGYIGSHTAIELLNKNHDVVIVDNFSNSARTMPDKIKKITNKNFKFYEADVCDEAKMEQIFQENKIDGVIHFAAYKAVGESVEKPLMYYENNLVSTIKLTKLCLKYNVNRFVYSSSATVYGDAKPPMVETMPIMDATNPYGQCKIICERILTDTAKQNPNFKVSLLRYFNPIGAHNSGLIGDDPNGIPNNLAPYIQKVLIGELDCLSVFGDDYDTVDGTGVRDYIHVVDLALSHIVAIEKMINNVNIYNVGTGIGTSVLELIQNFEKASNKKVNYKITARRAGDIDASFANVDKIKKELGWQTIYNIEDMCRDCWNFIQTTSQQ